MSVTLSRITAREGVNAAQALFEACGCVFQEVAQQNDFGKDAYVDVTYGDVLTSLCVALQIKSGRSFRTAQRDYFVPVGNHAHNWRRSTVPVFGVVYDPDDRLLRWVDITGWLREHPTVSEGTIPVSQNAILNAAVIQDQFAAAVAVYADADLGAVARNLLSPDDAIQTAGVLDAWKRGSADARCVVLLRRLLMELRMDALRQSIAALAHYVTGIRGQWVEDSLVLPPLRQQVVRSFKWAPQEVARMLSAVKPDEWRAGALGESLDSLLCRDMNVRAALHGAIAILLKNANAEFAVDAAALALTVRGGQEQELDVLAHEFPALVKHARFITMAEAVRNHWWFSKYDRGPTSRSS